MISCDSLEARISLSPSGIETTWTRIDTMISEQHEMLNDSGKAVLDVDVDVIGFVC
jgi:hypothetical protein